MSSLHMHEHILACATHIFAHMQTYTYMNTYMNTHRKRQINRICNKLEKIHKGKFSNTRYLKDLLTQIRGLIFNY